MKNIALFFLLILFLFPSLSALSVTINVNPSFNVGQKVSFNYTFLSDTPIQNGQYIVSTLCPNAPMPLVQENNFSLVSNKPLTKNYVYSSNLSDSILPQTCNATVFIIKPINYLQSKTFVLNTNPALNFSISLCKDIRCSEPAKVFVLNSTAYINYLGTSGLSIKSSITFPNGDTEDITLPANVTIDQKGDYILNVFASKRGYKTVNQSIIFGGIKEEPQIGYTSLSSEKTSVQGNHKNILLRGTALFIFVIIGAAVSIVVAMIVLIKILRNRKSRYVTSRK